MSTTVPLSDGSAIVLTQKSSELNKQKKWPGSTVLQDKSFVYDTPSGQATVTFGAVYDPPPKPNPTPTPPSPTPPTPPPAPSSGPSGVPGNWTKVWEDDFADFSNWDLTWPPAAVSQTPMNTTEIACYDPACATIVDGVATLQAIEKTQVVNGVTYQYATAVIATKNHGIFAEGDYVEFVACLQAAADGYIADWQALWTSGPNWPANGEDDIVESWGGAPTFHYHSPQGAPGGTAPGSWGGAFHRFGSIYGANTVTDYYDGVEVGSAATGGVTGSEYLLASILIDPTVNPAPLVIPCTTQLKSVTIWRPA